MQRSAEEFLDVIVRDYEDLVRLNHGINNKNSSS